MVRKSYLYIISVTLFVCAMIIIISALAAFDKKSQKKLGEIPQNSNSVSFVLREYQGNLALFRGNAETPYQTLEFDISYLSEYDRELLKEGISVDTQSELELLIEDFTG